MTVATAADREVSQLQAEVNRLTQVICDLQQQLRAADRTIALARDSSPVKRPRIDRVRLFAASLLPMLDVFRQTELTRRGKTRTFWVLAICPPDCLHMASLRRRFRSLKEVWEFLLDLPVDIVISDIFGKFLKVSGKLRPVLRILKDLVFSVVNLRVDNEDEEDEGEDDDFW